MATNKFKSKVSTNNLIEGAVPVEETGTPTPSIEEVVVTNPVEEVVDSGENPETAPPVNMVEEVTLKEIPERNVKICLRVNHSCSIGGVRYFFEKGKQYNVPASVKSILLQSDLLSPL